MGSTGSRGLTAAGPHFVEQLVEAGRCDAIVCAGTDVVLPDRLDVPVHRYAMLPLEELLPRTSLVISHGGAGSTYQALSSGLPVIVAATHRNHRVLGQILERLNVGLLLRPNRPSLRIDEARVARLRNNARQLAAACGRADAAQSAAAELSGML